MIFTTGLFIYHTKLITNNMTTKEELKKFFLNPFGDPFSRNCQRNCQNVLFPKLPIKTILDILEWNDVDENSTTDGKNENIKNDGTKVSNEIKHNNSIDAEKYSDVNEKLNSKENERIIPKFTFDLSFDNNNGNPL